MAPGALEFNDSSEPSDDTESEAGGDPHGSPMKRLKGPHASETSEHRTQRPRRHSAKRFDFVLDSSDDDAGSDGGRWYPSSESSNDEGVSVSRSPSPAHGPGRASSSAAAASHGQEPGHTECRLPTESIAALILKHESPDWASTLTELAAMETFGDIDGWRVEFAPSAMELVERRIVGNHSVHVIGAKFAKSRRLYEPDIWAFVGLQRPEARQGMGIAVRRNRHANRTLAQIGERVVIGGEEAVLTELLVDEGIQQLHKYLSDHRRGQDWTVRGLQRCAPGSHSIWESHKPIPIYKLVHACRMCELPILFFQFGMESNPTREPLLDMGVGVGHIPWVDFAIEVPGMYWYFCDEGVSSASKFPIPKGQFYPSRRSHQGGTFKWRAPVGERLERLRNRWRPSQRPYKSLVGYVHDLATGASLCSFGALAHIMAEVVQTVTVYHATYHETATLISNNVPTTFASALAAVREVEHAQRHLQSLMEKEERGEGPCFFMRYEVRIRNLDDLVRKAYLDDRWGLDETKAVSCASTFMRELTTLIYWYHFEIFAVGVAEVSTRRIADVGFPAFIPIGFAPAE